MVIQSYFLCVVYTLRNLHFYAFLTLSILVNRAFSCDFFFLMSPIRLSQIFQPATHTLRISYIYSSLNISILQNASYLSSNFYFSITFFIIYFDHSMCYLPYFLMAHSHSSYFCFTLANTKLSQENSFSVLNL